jgi:hypothetical protein
MTFGRPVAWDDINWRDAAACRHVDPDLFCPAGAADEAAEENRAAATAAVEAR